MELGTGWTKDAFASVSKDILGDSGKGVDDGEGGR
jgi:hypothetical protein